jgi:hypothetical protein
MPRFRLIAFAAAALASAAFTTPAQAQLQQIGVDPFGAPLCMGPLGPGRCADILAWMQRGGMQPGFGAPGPGFGAPAPGFMPQPAPVFGPTGPMGIPTGVVPRDGQLVAQIAQACRGEPRCMAAAWATEEFSRCSNGVGVPGGCFGPNGEIMRAIRGAVRDVTEGPGENNDLVGRKGWVCRTLFGGC